MSALPAFGVMFGVLNPIDRSASGNAIASIRNPPENRGPVAANVFGLPAAVVPVARTALGLPIGVQVIGRPGAEPQVLAAAAIIERDSGFY